MIVNHLINPEGPLPLFEGVVTCMLVALSLLAFLGLRYPLQMLPILLFEIAWKVIWTAVVVLPLWTAHQLDPATVMRVLYLPRGLDRGRRHSVALRHRAVRDEAGGPVALGGYPPGQ